MDEGERAVLHGEDDGVFGGVPVGVKGDGAGDGGVVLGGGEGVADFRAVGGAGATNGVDGEHGGVVAEDRKGIGGEAPAFLVALVKRDDDGSFALGGEVGAEVAALGGGAGDRQEIGGFPAVDSEEGEGEAEVAGLFADQGGFGVVTGDEDAVGTGGFDRGELGTENVIANQPDVNYVQD